MPKDQPRSRVPSTCQDPWKLPLESTKTSSPTRQVSITTSLVTMLEVTLSKSLVGVLKVVLTTGSQLTPGEVAGVTMVSSELRKVSVDSTLLLGLAILTSQLQPRNFSCNDD